MKQTRTEYADTVTLHNTDTGKDLPAEVLSFNPGKRLEVSIQRSIRVILMWTVNPSDKTRGFYVGSIHGKEFITDGPEEVTYRLNR